MKKISFISGDYTVTPDSIIANGCTYYRQVLPASLLKKNNDVKIGTPLADPSAGIGVFQNGEAFFDAEISVFKLLMHGSVPKIIKQMQSLDKKIIIDIDDFHFGIEEDNIAFYGSNPHISPDNNRAFYEESIRYADRITVSTNFLANFYEKRCRDVLLVRNSIDCDRFYQVDQPEKPIIGWLGGTLWRSGDIEMLREWLPNFSKKYKIEIHHAGHIPNDSEHFAVKAGLKRVTTSPVSSMLEVPKLLQNFHIGLIPLKRGSFNESKSYLKGLEYAASGIPFVATPTEEYKLLNSAGVGRLAETADEWWFHCKELLNPDTRKYEAEKNLQIVKEKFDISVMETPWLTAMTF